MESLLEGTFAPAPARSKGVLQRAIMLDGPGRLVGREGAGTEYWLRNLRDPVKLVDATRCTGEGRSNPLLEIKPSHGTRSRDSARRRGCRRRLGVLPSLVEGIRASRCWEHPCASSTAPDSTLRLARALRRARRLRRLPPRGR